MGRGAEILAADLSTIEPVGLIIEPAVAALCGLNIVVNTAGIIRRADAEDFTETNWDAW